MKDSETPKGWCLTDEIRSTVNAAMEALPEDLKTAIVLRELDGLSYEEIAAAMDCPWVRSDRGYSGRVKQSTAACGKYSSGWAATGIWDERGLDSQLSAMFDTSCRPPNASAGPAPFPG